MRRCRHLAATLLALMLVLTGCARGASPDEQPTTGSPTPSEPEPTDTAEPQATQEVTAWFVRTTQGEAWVEPRTTMGPETDAVAAAAMEYLLSGEPLDDPDVSRIVEGVEVLGVDRDGDVVVVDVGEEIDATGHSSMEETAFAQQLAYTATQFDGVRAVRLLVEGEEITDLWGHLDWSAPIEPEPFAETPITIEHPLWGAEVEPGELVARGEANTFEATLGVRLIAPDGRVVEQEWITATSGSGTRGTWEHRFSVPDEAGTWAIEAEEPDPSGGAEGRPPLVVRVEFTVP